MTIKASWLWNGTAAQDQLVFGFSETWYTNQSGDALIDIMRVLVRQCAGILAKDTFLYGYRIGQPGGRSVTVREFLSIGCRGVMISRTSRRTPRFAWPKAPPRAHQRKCFFCMICQTTW